MAITYLSGERIQGSSAVEKTATYSTTFGSTSGWSSNDTHVFIDTANNMLEFELDDDSTDEFLQYDMGVGNISNTEWVLRMTLTFTTWNGNTLDNNNALLIGCYDTASPSSMNSAGDYLSWGQYMRGTSSTDGFDTKMRSSNNGTPLESESNNNPFSPTTATDTPYYIELKRVSADLIEFRAFSDSNYSTQVGTTVTRVTTSAVTALRYITINLVAQGAIGGDGYTGYIQNLKFFNATTTATEAEKAAITNVPVGTRFEETDTRKIFRRKADISTTFDGTDENDWTDTFNDDIRGTKIQAGHTLIGKAITSITLKGRYSSGTTGTYKLALFNATGVVQHLFKTGSISALGGTSSGAEFTGNDSVNSGTVSARTVSADYIIGVTNSGNGSNRVQLRQSTSIGRANEITGKCASAGSAFVEAGENADLYMNISYLYDDWVEKGTA